MWKAHVIVQATTVSYCICKCCVSYCKCAVSICKWAPLLATYPSESDKVGPISLQVCCPVHVLYHLYHQWSSVVISGHQWASVVIIGHHWASVGISGHQWASVRICTSRDLLGFALRVTYSDFALRVTYSLVCTSRDLLGFCTSRDLLVDGRFITLL